MNSQYVGFIDDLIKKRHFHDLTSDEQEALKKDAMERFDTFMLHRMIEAFSPDDADAFVALLKEKKSSKELSHFAEEHIKDYESFMTDAVTSFSKNYIGINT